MLPRPILAAFIALVLIATACRLTSQTNSKPYKPPYGTPDAAQISGEEIFKSMGCSECHDKAAGMAAPSIVGLYGKMVTLENGETVLADDDYLRESILSPNVKIVSGYKPIMPDFQTRLMEEEVVALITYIRSLAK